MSSNLDTPNGAAGAPMRVRGSRENNVGPLPPVLERTGEPIVLRASNESVNSASFSPDGKRIVAATDDNTIITYSNYITLGPSINFGGFMVGANIGIPVGASMSNVSGSIKASASSTEGMAIITELRIGGMIPVMRNELGRLNFVVIGGYMINGMDNGYSSSYNPKAASLMMGFNFLLNFQRAE